MALPRDAVAWPGGKQRERLACFSYRQPRRDGAAPPSQAAWRHLAPSPAALGICLYLGGQLVDHGQARVDSRAVLGVDRAIDGSREHHTAALLKLGERIRPGWIVRREVRPGDGDQAATVGEACQGGADVAEGGVGHAAIDMGHRREWRVHQHHAGAHASAPRWSSICAASNRDVVTPGKRWVSNPARVSASSLRTSAPPASSARMASRPVPADGSSTRSAGVIAAAVLAARPSVIGVENCWSAWLSSERRVCVGRSPPILAASAAWRRVTRPWRA